MHSFRLRLIGLAFSVLTCQVAALAAAPALFYQAGAAGETGREILCECKEAPGSECPMHKGKTQTAGSEFGTLHACGGGGEQAAAILTMLTGGGGILQAPLHSTPPAPNGVVLAAHTSSTLNADPPPTSPPPRS